MVDLRSSARPGRPSRWIAGLRRGGPRLWVGGALVAVLFLVALLAPLIAPHDPIEQDLMSAQLPPAWIRAAKRPTRSAPTALAAACCRD